ncbi:uncharacterized protein I206_107333 [Kwoniella pini CBS 10737]|uniref:Uncharacterized protein n=1 Tax=Kwoniella pini CBS 10737 TaxID=1296096 RepID=A0A1B9HX20_9TREE|nr:uncharacterized protein I206_05660 [Kwoniella pini CBS 10737]OCF47801.1 hypothetical protein I206_05660 [Kwoniella pini CBS 10737]
MTIHTKAPDSIKNPVFGSELVQSGRHDGAVARYQSKSIVNPAPPSTKPRIYTEPNSHRLPEINKDCLNLVTEELAGWDDIAQAGLTRVLHHWDKIDERSKKMSEDYFGKELLVDNIVILKKLLSIISQYTNDNIHPEIIELYKNMVILLNMSILRSKPIVYALIFAALTFRVWQNLVDPNKRLEDKWKRTWAYQMYILNEISALGDSMFVCSAVSWHDRSDVVNAKERSWIRAVHEHAFSCDAADCPVPLKAPWRFNEKGELEDVAMLETAKPGTKARTFRSGGALFRLVTADGPRRTCRYPCPDCLHIKGDATQLHAVYILVWRLLHRRCRHSEGKQSAAGGIM